MREQGNLSLQFIRNCIRGNPPLLLARSYPGVWPLPAKATCRMPPHFGRYPGYFHDNKEEKPLVQRGNGYLVPWPNAR
ncbi:hypothetical protein SAMN02927924_00253 [Sphingobium faniae]|nr:hypothetical protein SAMN02927924_00253 [Sphingobium faniae]